ncbi:MAG: hypothetical protein AAF141_00725 [Pseudomonadota bacterium]
MTIPTSSKLFGLTALALPIVSGVASVSSGAGEGSPEPFDLFKLTTVFSLFIFLALVTERVCEVAVLALTRFKLIPPDPQEDPTATSSDIRVWVAMALCLIVAAIFTASGFEFLKATLEAFPDATPTDSPQFVAFDRIVTTLLIVGGADGLHSILMSLQHNQPSNDDEAEKQTTTQTKPAKVSTK